MASGWWDQSPAENSYLLPGQTLSICPSNPLLLPALLAVSGHHLRRQHPKNFIHTPTHSFATRLSLSLGKSFTVQHPYGLTFGVCPPR